MNKRMKQACSGTSILALMLMGAMTTANAQPVADSSDQDTRAAGGLEAIVVTAQKRSENLQTVPLAVAAVSSARLQASGVTNTQGLSTVVAGLSIKTPVQSFSPTIRGVGTTSFGPGIESPVALYVDDVYYASQLMGLSTLEDVAQVAVLKGPQGTLFGRNATGGVIQLTTRDPSHEFGGMLKTELDKFLTSRSYLYLTGGRDDLAMNVSVSYATQGDGWGKNIINGEDIHKIKHDISARTKWVWTPSDATTVKLSGDYTDRKNNLGANLRPAPGSVPLFPGLNKGLTTNNVFDAAMDLPNRNTYKGGGGSIAIEHETGFGRLVSISAYRTYNYSTIFDGDGSPIPVQDVIIHQKGKQFSQEFQIVSRDDQKLTWALGTFYFWARERANPLIAVLHGPAGPLGDATTITTLANLGTESLAWFAQASYEILPNTRLTGGLRYTYEKRTQDANQTAAGPATFGFSIPFPGDLPGRISDSKYTYRLALDHRFTDDIMAYVSYNRGFKSGGFNGLNPTNPAYRPEQLNAVEGGFKAELFDRTLRFNPSVFYYKYKDIQVTKITGPLPDIINGAKAKIYGVDLESEWQATSALRFNLGAEWLHAEFTDFPNMDATIPVPGGGNAPFVIPNGAGNRIPYAPRFTLNAAANYTLDLGNDSKVDFNVSNAYNSGYFLEPDNRLKQKSHNILGAAVTWTSGPVTLGVWGRNLLDKVVAAQEAGVVPFGDLADYTNPPRTYGFTASYKFGGL